MAGGQLTTGGYAGLMCGEPGVSFVKSYLAEPRVLPLLLGTSHPRLRGAGRCPRRLCPFTVMCGPVSHRLLSCRVRLRAQASVAGKS